MEILFGRALLREGRERYEVPGGRMRGKRILLSRLEKLQHTGIRMNPWDSNW